MWVAIASRTARSLAWRDCLLVARLVQVNSPASDLMCRNGGISAGCTSKSRVTINSGSVNPSMIIRHRDWQHQQLNEREVHLRPN